MSVVEASERLAARLKDEKPRLHRRYTIRFGLGAPDMAVLRFDLAPDVDRSCSIRACSQR